MSPTRRMQPFGYERVTVLDESHHPTGTFKDRLGQSLAAHLDRVGNNQPIVMCLSYGNTAFALARYCWNEQLARQRYKPVIFFPKEFRRRMWGPDAAGRMAQYVTALEHLEPRCSLLYVPFDDGFISDEEMRSLIRDRLGPDAEANEVIDVTNGLSSLGIRTYEGMLDEILESCEDGPPEYLIVPYGSGVLFRELIAEARERNLPTEVVGVSASSPDSLADKVYSPHWLEDAYELSQTGRTKAVGVEDGFVFSVDSQEIEEALEICETYDLESEPSGCVGLAFLRILHNWFGDRRSNSIAVVCTGNGLLNIVGHRGE